MTDEDYVLEYFVNTINNPLEWFRHSKSLLASARATRERSEQLIDVWEKSDLEQVASMLYGFALENLFKAIWVLQHQKEHNVDGKRPITKFPSEIKTHDLVVLANLVEPKLGSEYKESLYLLSEATIWSGRYPCSVNGEEGGRIRLPEINDDAEYIFKKCIKPFTLLA